MAESYIRNTQMALFRKVKIFRASVVSDRSLETKLAARRVVLDIALMRAAERSRREPFRQMVRTSIKRLREELRRGHERH